MAKLQFPGQRPEEKVLIKKRRYWFVLLQWELPVLILLVATGGIGLGVGWTLNLHPLPWAALILALILGPFGLFIWRFLDWENDHYFVTDERVIHIERIYFVFESRHEAPLTRIQDVSFRMPTPLHNLLDYGDVTVETASRGGQIRFAEVHHPRECGLLIAKVAGLPKEQVQLAAASELKPKSVARSLLYFFPELLARMLYPIYPTNGDVIIWRKHWWVLLKSIMPPTFSALLTLFLGAVVFVLHASPVIFVVLGVVFLILVGWIAFRIIDWHNDIYLLTIDHVIDIEKRPFTREFRREANMATIQNVSYEQPSFLAKLLDFGNVRLETAGTLGEFTFDNVPRPRLVQETITNKLRVFRERSARRARDRQDEQIARIVERVLQARQRQ